MGWRGGDGGGGRDGLSFLKSTIGFRPQTWPFAAAPTGGDPISANASRMLRPFLSTYEAFRGSGRNSS